MNFTSQFRGEATVLSEAQNAPPHLLLAGDLWPQTSGIRPRRHCLVSARLISQHKQ